MSNLVFCTFKEGKHILFGTPLIAELFDTRITIIAEALNRSIHLIKKYQIFFCKLRTRLCFAIDICERLHIMSLLFRLRTIRKFLKLILHDSIDIRIKVLLCGDATYLANVSLPHTNGRPWNRRVAVFIFGIIDIKVAAG